MLRVFIFALALWAQPLQATTVQRFGLEDLAANAERIVVGVCSEAAPRLIGGQIYTRYLFTVDQALKGTTATQLELHLPGGHLQGVFTRIAGMPVFTPGEEAVLFLTATNELGHAWPVGLAQGNFAIVRDKNDAPRVYQELDGLVLHAPLGAAKQAPVAPIQGMPLDLFLAQVRTLTQPAGETDNAP